jgi:hypothetical protein
MAVPREHGCRGRPSAARPPLCAAALGGVLLGGALALALPAAAQQPGPTGIPPAAAAPAPAKPPAKAKAPAAKPAAGAKRSAAKPAGQAKRPAAKPPAAAKRSAGAKPAAAKKKSAAKSSAAAKPAPAGAGESFEAFCAIWMQKLAVREWANLTRGPFRERDGTTVIEYVGYDRRPSRCESRVRARGKPGLGILVYREHSYRRTGPSPVRAFTSEPQVVTSVEITEVFRNDGKRWVY